MPVDLRAAIRGALDVTAPPFASSRIRTRAAERLRALARRRSRSVLSLAALVAGLAIFAGGSSVDATGTVVAALPAPAPAPAAT